MQNLKLGFGLMRLPQKDGAIDIEQTKEMVDLIRSSASIAFDCVFSQNLSEATSTYFAFNEDHRNIGENITSDVESRAEKLRTELKNLTETIANLK